MHYLDKRSYNTFNLSGVTRLTGSLAFIVNLVLVAAAFFVFQFPIGLAAVAASILGVWFSAMIDPTRRNAMSFSSNFLFAFGCVSLLLLNDSTTPPIVWLKWFLLAGAGALFIGAFVGPSSNKALQQAIDEQKRHAEAIAERNKAFHEKWGDKFD